MNSTVNLADTPPDANRMTAIQGKTGLSDLSMLLDRLRSDLNVKYVLEVRKTYKDVS